VAAPISIALPVRKQCPSLRFLCATSVFSVSRWWFSLYEILYNGVTENTEVAQRRMHIKALPACP
jgi:hypothetical protein